MQRKAMRWHRRGWKERYFEQVKIGGIVLAVLCKYGIKHRPYELRLYIAVRSLEHLNAPTGAPVHILSMQPIIAPSMRMPLLCHSSSFLEISFVVPLRPVLQSLLAGPDVFNPDITRAFGQDTFTKTSAVPEK